MSFTTTKIISAVKRKGSFPTSSTDLFSPTDFMDFAYEELLTTIIPLIADINEDYFVEYADLTVVSGTASYRMPSRASAIRSIQIISSNNVTPLTRLWEEDRTSIDNNQLGYFIKGNQIILSPTPTSSSDTLRLVYVRRPSKYVSVSECAQISSIAGTTITVSSLPSTMTNGTLVDFSQANSPYDILTMSSPIASASGTTLTFSSIHPDLAVGDYISLANESCVPGIQEELVPILIQSILCACLTSKKDDSAKLELQKLEQQKMSVLDLLTPRIKSSDNKIHSRNSLLTYFRR